MEGVVLYPNEFGVQLQIANKMITLITFVLCMSSLPSISEVWNISDVNFNDVALRIFQYQSKNNKVYAEYLRLIDKNPKCVNHYTQIPFLPISFFKTHSVVSQNFNPQKIFTSSGTTSQIPSKHNVKSLDLYHTNCAKIITQLIGDIGDYSFYGLLPSYLEREQSSLVDMVSYFMTLNGQEQAFYLYNHQALYEKLKSSRASIVLFGVSFALLDFAEHYRVEIPNLTIIETGGMKGRKTEITKGEVYEALQSAFPNAIIRSEYGMTELMSQAYSDIRARYRCPAWMKVLGRADNDPLSYEAIGHTAALNIIDLANLYTCCFIATDDLGRVYGDGSFDVSGRLDDADLRGCSLLVI